MIVRGRHPRLRQAAVGLAMLSPALVLFLTFVGYPTVDALWVSLHQWTGFTPRGAYVGLEHYRLLFGQNAFRALPLVGALLAAAGGGMALGRRWARAIDPETRQLGRKLGSYSGLALAGLLLSFLLIWMFAWKGDGDDYFRSCVRHNFSYMLIGGAFHFVYAFVFAAALSLPNFRAKAFYRTMIFFPSFISAVGVAMLWLRVYDSRSGLLTFLLGPLGMGGFEWLSADNMVNSIIACGVWAGVGSQMILLLAGIQRIPETYYEAARIDGAGEGRIFLHVTIPLLRDVILIVITLWVIGSLKVFGLFQAFTIGVEEHSAVISTRQYDLAFSNRSNIYMMGYATAMAVVLMVLVIVFAVALRSLREQEQVEY